ncbi:helix-turn-helix transcriptional regulator [Cytobacillus purgationiresistens]|nr:helix-turn-helix transcriptional regulator [Cytobacillus purgationiresistens]
MNVVVNNLGELIKNSPYKRSYIEKYMKVSRNTLSNWCTSKTYPSVSQILILCELLNVNFEDIYKLRKEDIF